MDQKILLHRIRLACAGQFIVVFLAASIGGFSKFEMLCVFLSASFGLLCDGFFHTAWRTRMLSKKRKLADMEFDDLLKRLDRGGKDQGEGQ